MGYCPIFLRSWWPLAPPAEVDTSSWEVSGSTSFGEVWLVGAGVGLVVKVEDRAGAEVLTDLFAARVVDGGRGSRTRGGNRGEK